MARCYVYWIWIAACFGVMLGLGVAGAIYENGPLAWFTGGCGAGGLLGIAMLQWRERIT